ncbi:hypothetical protein AB0D08_28585 [Kitasatospora sp. NPDC048540]|uniref:hypothetical protein n=1 Tax=Kitasatospora sp. NPDC048540 TaxID=3155634 RepID=UPI0033F5E294
MQDRPADPAGRSPSPAVPAGPRASYPARSAGRRALTLVVDLADPAAVVPLCEPFWLEFNAEVTVFPCMNAEDPATGIDRLGAD